MTPRMISISATCDILIVGTANVFNSSAAAVYIWLRARDETAPLLDILSGDQGCVGLVSRAAPTYLRCARTTPIRVVNPDIL